MFRKCQTRHRPCREARRSFRTLQALTYNPEGDLWVLQSHVPQEGQHFVDDLGLVQAVQRLLHTRQHIQYDLQVTRVLLIHKFRLRKHHSSDGCFIQVFGHVRNGDQCCALPARQTNELGCVTIFPQRCQKPSTSNVLSFEDNALQHSGKYIYHLL